MGILGKRLTKALLNEKSISKITESGFRPEDLFDDGKEAYEWALNYYGTTGKWPTPLMIEENTGVELPEEEADDLEYILELIGKRTLGKNLQRRLEEAAIKLEKRDPNAALSVIKDASLKLLPTKSTSNVVSYRKSGASRIESYLRAKEVGGFEGITTPWDNLDEYIQGWVNGTLNVITAMQNIGKSWFSVIIACDCLEKGKNVLFITMEMPASRIERRIDSIRYKIPFKDLRDTVLDDFTEERWIEEVTDEMEKDDADIYVADKKSVKLVSDVSALVFNYKPDIVIIDGGYRFTGKGRSHWESTTAIVGELQLAAEITEIPWLVTTQQGDASESGKEPKRGPKMRAWNVRYGKEWVINPDVVLGLYQNDDLRLLNVMDIYMLKIRDHGGNSNGKPQFRINWDFDASNFSEIVTKSDVAERVKDDTKYTVEF